MNEEQFQLAPFEERLMLVVALLGCPIFSGENFRQLVGPILQKHAEPSL
jgi:hypothetical protein